MKYLRARVDSWRRHIVRNPIAPRGRVQIAYHGGIANI